MFNITDVQGNEITKKLISFEINNFVKLMINTEFQYIFGSMITTRYLGITPHSSWTSTFGRSSWINDLTNSWGAITNNVVTWVLKTNVKKWNNIFSYKTNNLSILNPKMILRFSTYDLFKVDAGRAVIIVLYSLVPQTEIVFSIIVALLI